MNPIRIGFVGSGWRVESFLRVIREVPQLFELSGILFHRAEKAEEFALTHPGKAFTTREELLASEPDFVVVAVPWDAVAEHLSWLMDAKMPVLCETPPANSVHSLESLWDEVQEKGGRIQVAEQYFLQPYHAAVQYLVHHGAIGRVETVMLSMMHDYHSISVMRKLLDAGYCHCRIEARSYNVPVYKTCDRTGMLEPELMDDLQKCAVFRFENETAGFHRFSDQQYFNYLRSRHLQVQGDAGEIYDQTLLGLNRQDQPYRETIRRVDTGDYSNLEGMFHRAMMVGNREIYRSPFAAYTHARLNDDEIAIGTMLLGMKEYVDTGKDVYSLADGLQDSYLWFLMDEAIRTSRAVETRPMPWQREVYGW